MTKRASKYWAIKLSRNWVEIRQGPDPPVAVMTKLIKPIRGYTYRWGVENDENGMARAVRRRTKKELTIENLIHKGGKVLGSLEMQSFRGTMGRKFNKYIPRDFPDPLELTKTQVDSLIKKEETG
jgi:hypothetical protein